MIHLAIYIIAAYVIYKAIGVALVVGSHVFDAWSAAWDRDMDWITDPEKGRKSIRLFVHSWKMIAVLIWMAFAVIFGIIVPLLTEGK